MRWVLFVAVAGCAAGGTSDNMPGPSTLGPATTAGTETPVMGSSGDGDGDGDGDGSTTTGTPVPGSTSGSSSTGAPITTDPGDSSSSSEGEPMCIEEAQDDVCIACIKEYCCPEYDACVVDKNCNCALECIAEGMMPAEDCASACGTSAAVTGLFVCGYLSCKADCQGI